MIVHYDDFLKGGKSGAIQSGLTPTQTNEKINPFDVFSSPLLSKAR
jgi:hypothetical protein